jgi:hypothetical protein
MIDHGPLPKEETKPMPTMTEENLTKRQREAVKLKTRINNLLDEADDLESELAEIKHPYFPEPATDPDRQQKMAELRTLRDEAVPLQHALVDTEAELRCCGEFIPPYPARHYIDAPPF